MLHILAEGGVPEKKIDGRNSFVAKNSSEIIKHSLNILLLLLII